ncbi:MAG: hypothetical protein J0M15_10255 [Deltaproteobacteria bacterium]|nr:hypothetical protein [Deltaproteobacteria bacterium]
MKFIILFFGLLIFSHTAIADQFSFRNRIHFTQGRFKIDKLKYKYINSKSVSIFKGKKNQSFEIEAIKSKDLTFYTLTVKRGDSIVLIINDFAVMSKTSKIRMLKEGWIEDVNNDGYFDIVQREKTFISNRNPASNDYTNDKLRIKVWDTNENIFIETDPFDAKYKAALKKYNFKLYTLSKGKII